MIKNVLEYLQNSAERFPNKVSYSDSHQELTFLELNTIAKRIGTSLASLSVKRSPIMIVMEKSALNIASFMGVLYSGNFYVPIDVSMPLERMQSITDTLQPIAVITDSKHIDKVKKLQSGFKVFDYQFISCTEIDEELLDEIQETILDIDPAYVLFTSGSTGIPKGVVVNHRGIIDFTDWMTEKFSITEDDCFANQSPFHFDLSIGDVFCTLKTGCTNYIVPHELFMFPVRLIEYLNEKHVSIIFWVPSALCVIANLRAFERIKPMFLTRVLFCGEVMPNKQLNVWRRAIPNALFANLYGPCETVDASTCYIVEREFEDDDPLPIGFPCNNTEIIVLNEDDRLVKDDEVGELCIRGCSLSLGYYNNKEKTASSFVQNPLNRFYNDLIYRTGDMVRYNKYGELMYVGRKDFQIKHMGHRIELGEIETAVDTIESIDTRACVYDDDKNRIVLFYKGKYIDEQCIRSVLKNKLPEYMMPGHMVQLNVFPYNVNGKIDRLELKRMLKDK